jgi:hypothetical protein
MSYLVNLILTFAGSLCATSCLAAGEALRTGDQPFWRRMTPRMLLSLALLSCATVGTALALFLQPSSLALGACISLLLLAAGTGATLWAYVAGPPYRGGESLGERLTRRGKLALALLTLSQIVDLGAGAALAAVASAASPSGSRALETLEHLQASSQQSVSILALLGLFLMTLGTAVAVATFRSSSPLSPEGGYFLKRMSLLARGAFLILGLALAVVGFASLLKPEVGMFICLMLLSLGIVSGLLALFSRSKPGVDEPARWGISSRGWVSLTLIALAGVVLVAQEARALGPLGTRTDAGEPNPRVQTSSSTDSSMKATRTPGSTSPSYGVLDLSKGLRTSPRTSTPARTVVEDEARQLRRQVQELKRQVQELESRLSTLQAQATTNPGAAAPSVPTASKGSPVVVDLTNGLQGPSARAAPERSKTPPTYPTLDLSQGIRRVR